MVLPASPPLPLVVTDWLFFVLVLTSFRSRTPTGNRTSRSDAATPTTPVTSATASAAANAAAERSPASSRDAKRSVTPSHAAPKSPIRQIMTALLLAVAGFAVTTAVFSLVFKIGTNKDLVPHTTAVAVRAFSESGRAFLLGLLGAVIALIFAVIKM